MKEAKVKNNSFYEQGFESHDGAGVILIDFDNNSFSVVEKSNDRKLIFQEKMTLSAFVEHFANTRVHPAEIDKFINFFKKDNFEKDVKESGGFSKKTYIEYNGVDSWNEVEIFIFKAPWAKAGEPIYLMLHNVIKFNVSPVGEDMLVPENYNVADRHPLTGLPMSYAFRDLSKKKLDESDDDFCIITVKIMSIDTIAIEYGHEVLDRMISAIGSFLHNMDIAYGTISAYDGKADFISLVKCEKKSVDYLEHGINNLIGDFEGIKGRACMCAIKISDRKTLFKTYYNRVKNIAKTQPYIPGEITWYDPDCDKKLRADEVIKEVEDNVRDLMNNKSKAKTKIDDYIEEMLAKYLVNGMYSDEDIADFLEKVRDVYNVDSAYISVTLPDRKAQQIVYEAVKNISYRQLDYIVPLDQNKVNYIIENHNEDGIVEFKIEFLEKLTMPNMMQKMFFRDDFFDGAVGMKTYYKHEWTDEERNAVSKMSVIFKPIVENKRLAFIEQYISKLERVDVLTNLLNRNAFEAQMEEKNEVGKGVGVVYADLDGLKECNDKYGHDEGDKMLCMAANIFMSFFPYNSIYRFGGDEFVIVEWDISQDELYEKMVDFFSYLSSTDQISISVGIVWKDKDCNVKEMLRIADEKMYETKKNYYTTGRHGDIALLMRRD